MPSFKRLDKISEGSKWFLQTRDFVFNFEGSKQSFSNQILCLKGSFFSLGILYQLPMPSKLHPVTQHFIFDMIYLPSFDFCCCLEKAGNSAQVLRRVTHLRLLLAAATSSTRRARCQVVALAARNARPLLETRAGSRVPLP